MRTTALGDTQRRLLAVWSQPLRHAHPDWLKPLPSAWMAGLEHAEAARRACTRWLREQVPLPRLADLDTAQRWPWAVADQQALQASANRAAAFLLRGWITRAVRRSDREKLIELFGLAAYEAALAAKGSNGPDSPPAPEWPYTLPAPELALRCRALGLAAIQQALAGTDPALCGLVRLVCGPHAAVCNEPLGALRADALLDHLTRLHQAPALQGLPG